MSDTNPTEYDPSTDPRITRSAPPSVINTSTTYDPKQDPRVTRVGVATDK